MGTSDGRTLDIVILGLSITSSWGNGHATTFRALVRELDARGHEVLFLERDVPWYAAQRDLPEPPYGRTELYRDLDELKGRFGAAVAGADAVIVGSFVPDGVEVGRWVTTRAGGVTAFYDIDTPVTLAKLEAGDHEYLDPDLVPRYDLYLSFTGGPTLTRLERKWRARRARPLYCSVDAERYRPAEGGAEPRWDLGYLGTYAPDRQEGLERLLLGPARRWPEGRFAVAGPQFPEGVRWPANVERFEHVPPGEHPAFYTAQRFTLNLTRAAMREAGWAPSVRLFEATACGVPVIGDRWPGLEEFFAPGEEILIADGPDEALAALRGLPEDERLELAARGRERTLAHHTAAHRAEELVGHLQEVLVGA